MNSSQCRHKLYKTAYVDKNKWLYQCSECASYLIADDTIIQNDDANNFIYSSMEPITNTDVMSRLSLAGASILC